MADNKMTFEEALARLEELAAELERGNITLEQSLKYYEEGAALAAFCNEQLRSAQQRVTELSLNIAEAEEASEE